VPIPQLAAAAVNGAEVVAPQPEGARQPSRQNQIGSKGVAGTGRAGVEAGPEAQGVSCVDYSLTLQCIHGASAMSKIVEQVIAANTAYAGDFGQKAELALPPARHFAILTCMDARLDPAKYAGLAEGDAHVIRNAGGRATDDAIRSLIISHKLLGTLEWFVIHHTNCGMELFDNEVMANLLAESLQTASLADAGWQNTERGEGSPEGRYINWLTIRDQAASVCDDVRRIRSHPLVPNYVPIYGYIYDVRTGRLSEIPEATALGRPIARS
jgi:carbonic anhydrase